MLLALLLTVSARSAEPEGCPDPERLVHEAWGEYQSAEVEAARQRITTAVGALACQTQIVPPSVLLEMFWLQALVSLSAGDASGTDAALRRSIAVDARPVARPPLKYGPELRQQWATLALAASREMITLTVGGPDPVWVDGQRVDPGRGITVASGVHLIQERRGDLVTSRVAPFAQSRFLTPPVPAPAPLTRPASPPPAARRSRPPVLAIGAAAAGAAAIWALSSGARSHASFRQSAYRAASYEGCAFGETCYPTAREQAVRSDAARINRVYGIGYGMAAVSSGLLTITIVGLPSRDRTE